MPNLQVLRTLAEEKKVTLRKIAEIAGLSEQGLHKAINKEDIKFSSLDKIANYFGIDLNIFSDYKSTTNETNVSARVIGNVQQKGDGSTNVLGNITHHINLALPEEGKQKIIKPDGKIEIEPLAPKNEELDLVKIEKQNLLDKVELQQQLIKSLQDQLAMYRKGEGH